MKTSIKLFFFIFSFTIPAHAGEVFIKISGNTAGIFTKLIISKNDVVMTELPSSVNDTIHLTNESKIYSLPINEDNYLIRINNINNRYFNLYLIPGDTIEINIETQQDNYQLSFNNSKYKETNFENQLLKQFYSDNKYVLALNKCTNLDSATNLINTQSKLIRKFIDSTFLNYPISEKFNHYLQNYFLTQFLFNKILITKLYEDKQIKIKYLETLAKSLDSISSEYFSPKNCYFLLNSIISKILELKKEQSNLSVDDFLEAANYYFKNNELNQLSKIKILENEILFGMKPDEFDNIKRILLNIKNQLPVRYWNHLYSFYERRVNNDVGAILRDFELRDNYGKLRKLSEFKGQFTYLIFSGSWCPPCLVELNYVQNYIKSKTPKLNLVFVFLEGDVIKWKKFTENLSTFPIYLVTTESLNSEFLNSYMVKGVPKSFLLDPELKILKTNSGFDKKEVEEIFEKYK